MLLVSCATTPVQTADLPPCATVPEVAAAEREVPADSSPVEAEAETDMPIVAETPVLVPDSIIHDSSEPVESETPVVDETPAVVLGSIESFDAIIEGSSRQIPVTIVLPAGSDFSPLVVIMHGHGGSRQENGGFAGIAQALAEKGIASVRMDFAGCGDSSVSFIENNMTSMLEDARAAGLWAVETQPVDSRRIGLLGYSMGGRLALVEASRGEFDYGGIALLAPATMPYSTQENIKNYVSAYRTGAYEQPWYGSTLTIGSKWFEDLFITDKVMNNLPPMGNVLILHGTEDTVVPRDSNQKVADALGVTLVDIPGADHGYGFYSDQSEVTALVEETISEFFAASL